MKRLILILGSLLLAPCSLLQAQPVIQFATQAEVNAGTARNKAVSPLTLASWTGATGLPSQTGNSGKFLTTNGTVASWATLAGGGDALVANPLSQFAATTSAQLRSVLSDETGTGIAYFVGGALGTPASGTATNLTGLPISSGVSGLGTGIATALAINTGSAGAPVLFNGAGGTPASLTLTNATGLPQAGTVGLTTADSPQFAGVNVGNASDTTITRTAAGAIAVEGAGVFTTTTKADVLEAAIFAADAGANDTYTATLSPAITAYVTGARYRFKANTANTGAATINLNSLGAKTIVKVQGGITTALADNDIRAGQWVEVVYAGTNMQMTSMLGNAPAGSGDALVANPLSQFAATTSAQLAGVLSDETGSSGGFTRDTGATHTTATFAGVTTITGTINYSTVDTVTAGTSVDVTLGFGSITKSADSTITFSTDSVTATRVITRVLTNSDGSNARTFTFDTVTDFLVTVPASSSSTVTMKSQGASGWALVNGSPSVLNLTADTAPASTRLVASTDATTGAERKSTLAQLGDGVTGLSANGAVVRTGANTYVAGKADLLEAAYFAADAGANDTYTATLSPAITAYVTGARYRFKANTANTGAATINFNSLGAKTIVKVAGGITTTLADNDIRSGQWCDLVYDGTNMQLQSTLGNAAAGGTTVGYALNVRSGQSSSFDPTDASTIYIGSGLVATPQTSANSSKVYIPKAGTIKVAEIMWGANNANGTNENISAYIRINDTTDTLIATVGDTNYAKRFSNTGLSVAVSAGDYYEIKIVCPTWATNPTQVFIGGHLYIE